MLYSIETMPQWDEALEALLVDSCVQQGRPLVIEDLQQLAVNNRFRLDDILETLLKLVSCGVWVYREPQKNNSKTHGELVKLSSVRRISDSESVEFTGSWSIA